MDLLAIAAAPILAYLVVAGLVALDAAVPAVPSDAAVVAAGALAATGHLDLAWCFLAVVAGSIAGDHLVYAVARHRLPRILDRSALGRRLRRRAEQAARGAAAVTTGVLAMGRFVPFGRTAAAATAGVAAIPPRRYLLISLLGATGWSAWLVGLGYVTGEAVGGPLWRQVAVACAVGLAAALAVAGVYRLTMARRRRPADSGPVPAHPPQRPDR